MISSRAIGTTLRGRRAFCRGAVALAAVSAAGCAARGSSSESAQEALMEKVLDLPDLGPLGSFHGATGWLNSRPLAAQDLERKVVLVDFWTFTCINWIRTAAYIRAWAEKYRDHGLVVIGVHTPEFSFEHDAGNVARAATAMNVTYPVALDSDYSVWNDFGNQYWPALYIADADGRIRYQQFGEGDYDRAERVIQALLSDAGHDDIDRSLVHVDPVGIEVAADWDDLGSGETYIGYAHGQSPASPDGLVAGKAHDYHPAIGLALNEWDLTGRWNIGPEAAVSVASGARVRYRFHARDVHLVMGSPAKDAAIPFRVFVDGAAPGPSHGADIGADGSGVAREQRLYQLIRQVGPIAERIVEIEFRGADIEAVVFTFG